jgi:hypothetical protein
MIPFYSRFPDLAVEETRSVKVRGDADLPEGEYGFIEFYCEEPACDCRRVLVSVVSPDPGWTPWATISFGWESLQFYLDRLGDLEDAAVAKGPSLDPLNPQTKYAPALLELFRFVLTDDAYVERLKRHYLLFKDRVQGSQTAEGHPRKRKKGKRKRKK